MGPGTAFPPIPREDHPVRAACLCNIIKYSTREKPVDETLFSTVLENTIEDFNDQLKSVKITLTDLKLSCLCSKYCIPNELRLVDKNKIDKDIQKYIEGKLKLEEEENI